MPGITTLNVQTGESITREMTPEEVTELEALAPTVEQLEEDVQEVANEILINGDRDLAMAFATIDLVIAARDGNLDGLTRPQIRDAYRDRVIFYLRERRGIST